MISALVYNVEDFIKSHEEGLMRKSISVELGDKESLFSDSLENYSGSFSNMCLGLCVSDGSKAIDIYKKYSSLLPIKTNDIVILVRVDSDECLYYNLDKLNNFLYFDKGLYSNLVEYEKTDGLCYSLFSDVEFGNAESAFLVTDDWDLQALGSSPVSLKALAEKVKCLDNSNVWGS